MNTQSTSQRPSIWLSLALCGAFAASIATSGCRYQVAVTEYPEVELDLPYDYLSGAYRHGASPYTGYRHEWARVISTSDDDGEPYAYAGPHGYAK